MVWARAAMEVSLSSGLSGDCPGGVTAVSQEGAGCKAVPGAMGTQLPRVCASWQQLQRAQSMPEGARSFPRQRNARLCPDPLGPSLQPAQWGPRDDFGTKGSRFFFFFSFKRPGSRCRAGFPQCACLGPATPPLIPVGLPLPFPGAFPGQ